MPRDRRERRRARVVRLRSHREGIDQALAGLGTGVLLKPALSVGYARLSGGRIVVILDAASPPGGVHAVRAHASTLAFEMSVGRQQVVVSAGPGAAFGAASELISRQTSSHSALEVAGASSAEFSSGDLAARVFGPRLSAGPSLASVRQAQDATGQWLLATHDGYAASHGLLHERRVFVDARGGELRGEDILTVPDAAARERFLNRAYDGTLSVIVRFHLHADVIAEFDPTGDCVNIRLPDDERWVFRAAGGRLAIEPAMHYDPLEAAPIPSRQILVVCEASEAVGQIIWAFTRLTG